MTEFELIERIVATLGAAATGADVVLGPGDDAALVSVPAGFDLAITTDTLVAGRHFPADARGHLVGQRALGVNLSDLAAMGAEARHCVVSLTLPEASPAWVEGLACGMAETARCHGVAIVGGNLSRGPLAITVAAHGLVPCGKALLRSGARVGDAIFVSGEIGAGHRALLRNEGRFYAVRPRLALGMALRGVATAAIDVSDGLLADLAHVCAASGVGAEVALERVPMAEGVDPMVALTAGDDYELLFTGRRAPPAGEPVTAIGRITSGAEITLLHHGRPMPLPASRGHRHF